MHTRIDFSNKKKEVVQFELSGDIPNKPENIEAIEAFLNHPTIKEKLLKTNYETFDYLEYENTPIEHTITFFTQSFDFAYSENIEELVSIYQDTFRGKIMTDFFWSKENTIKRLHDEYHNIKPVPQDRDINHDEIPF